MPSPNERSRDNPAFVLSRRMYSIKTELHYAVWMVIVMLAWIAVFAVADWLGGQGWSSWAWDVIVFVGFLIWIIGALSVRLLVRASRVIRDWSHGYLAYAYLVAFEFTPRKGNDIARDVVSKLMVIYPDLEKEHGKFDASVEYKTTVEGKKASHEFEAAAHGPDSLFLVKDKTSQTDKMNENDLAVLMGQASDITKKEKGYYLEGVIVVTSAGFTEKAVEYVSDRKNWLHPDASRYISLTLLQTTPDGYSVVWMPYPRSS